MHIFDTFDLLFRVLGQSVHHECHAKSHNAPTAPVAFVDRLEEDMRIPGYEESFEEPPLIFQGDEVFDEQGSSLAKILPMVYFVHRVFPEFDVKPFFLHRCKFYLHWFVDYHFFPRCSTFSMIITEVFSVIVCSFILSSVLFFVRITDFFRLF